MGEAVIDVVKLVGPKPTVLLRQAFGLPIVVARIAVGFLRHGDHCGSQGSKQLYLLGRLVFCNDNDRPIAFRLGCTISLRIQPKG